MTNFAELKPRIVVIGVGGAGGNAVNNMIASNLEGAEFVVCNTDAQALSHASTDCRIQLGATITQGLGAGAKPEVGRAAAEESIDTIMEHVEGANMVFITAGMGGGTGTGAAPAIANACRQRGILTVGVVTKPFSFEGHKRTQFAEMGVEELKNNVDTLIIIPNQNLFRIANEQTSFADAFKMADNVLYQGVRGVTDLMVKPGLVNLDFNDIRTVMSEMGKAMMGTGESDGEKRAITAAESAISNPLLDDVTMKGARGVLVNITGSSSMTMFEVDEAANRIRAEIDDDAEFIFGCTFDESLGENIRVSVVATGIEDAARGKGAIPTFARPTPTVPSFTPTASPVQVTQPTTAPAAPEFTSVTTPVSQVETTETTVTKAADTDKKQDVSADDIVNILQGNAPAPQVEETTDENTATPLFASLSESISSNQEKSSLDVSDTTAETQTQSEEQSVTIGQTYSLDSQADGSLALKATENETKEDESKGSIWSSMRKLLNSDDKSGKSEAEVVSLTTQVNEETATEVTTSAQPENQTPVFQSVSTMSVKTEETETETEKTEKNNSETKSTILDDNDDSLEIPAFLRRQAN